MVNVNNLSCQELTMEEMEMVNGGDNGQGPIMRTKFCNFMSYLGVAMVEGRIAMNETIFNIAFLLELEGC